MPIVLHIELRDRDALTALDEINRRLGSLTAGLERIGRDPSAPPAFRLPTGLASAFPAASGMEATGFGPAGGPLQVLPGYGMEGLRRGPFEGRSGPGGGLSEADETEIEALVRDHLGFRE